MRYDAWLYDFIAERGYSLAEHTTSLHPLYPLLARLLLPFTAGNVPLALLIVSTCSCVALCVVFSRYVERFHGDAYATYATWLLLLLPPGFILLAPYTESTFLACAVGSVFAIRLRRWWLAGLLGGLAALTRQQGLVLVLPLAWSLGQAIHRREARPWHGLAATLVPIGYGIFWVYRAVVLGDMAALAQTHSLVELVHAALVSQGGNIDGQRVAWPWELAIRQFALIRSTTGNLHLVIDMGLGLGLALLTLLGLRDMAMEERLYALGVVALALCYYIGDINPYMALPRHIMIAFPLFIVLARRTRAQPHVLIGACALLVNALLAGLVVVMGWIP
jgi:hypothetical protein